MNGVSYVERAETRQTCGADRGTSRGIGWTKERAMFTDEQVEYIENHVWAVLATGRADGSPQVGMIGYHFDGERFTISAKAYTAKWKNALRNNKLALLIHDGRTQLIVYGTAECIDHDPERAQLTADVWGVIMGGDSPDPESLIATLDEQQRTVIRITPDRVFFTP